MIDDKMKRAERMFFVTIGLLFLVGAAAKTDVCRSPPCRVDVMPLGRAGSVLEGGESLG